MKIQYGRGWSNYFFHHVTWKKTDLDECSFA
jgi:hypothetical protein